MDDTAILSNPKTAENRIYVGNLTTGATASLLHEKFSYHGRILGMSRKGTSFCFIEFDSDVAAQNAIETENETNFCGRKIVVRKAEMKNHPRKRKRDDELIIEGPSDQSNLEGSDPLETSPGLHQIASTDAKSDATFQKIAECAIIIVDDSLRFYAETIKHSLSKSNFLVDIIVNDDFRTTARIVRSRGRSYAIQVNKYHQMTKTMTVAVLSHDPTEHQNLSFELGIRFINHDFQRSRIENLPRGENLNHPENISNLLNKLCYNFRLTTLQYQQLMSYLDNQCKIQRKLELGEINSEESSSKTCSNLCSDVKSESLQTKIYEILKRRQNQK